MMWKFPTYEPDHPINWDRLEKQFSWFSEMRDVPQDPYWHAEGDVFVHTKMVVDALIQLPEFKVLSGQDKHMLFAAALMHDIEKRSTTTTEIIDGKERIISPRHAKKGEFTVREILYKDIPTPFPIREQIAKLVRLHGLPIWAIEKQNPQKAVIEASLELNTKHLSILAKADVLGRICKDQEEILLKIELFNELCMENNCFGNARAFPSSHGRYLYLNKPNSSPDYEPFDNLDFTVFMLSGLPGTGKDTYIKTNLDHAVLSLDEIRRSEKISPTDKKGNGKVIQIAQEKAREYLRSKTSFVFNATNISKSLRQKWIGLFTTYGAKVKIIYLEVPYEKLLSQNHNREFKVPEKVIAKMIKRLEIPRFEEAHEVVFMTDH